MPAIAAPNTKRRKITMPQRKPCKLLVGPVPRVIWHPRNHAKIIVRSWWQSGAAIQIKLPSNPNVKTIILTAATSLPPEMMAAYYRRTRPTEFQHIAHGTIYFRSKYLGSGSVQASLSYFSRAACIRSVACQARSTVSRKVHTSSYKSVIF
jgi:hypothetical protein